MGKRSYVDAGPSAPPGSHLPAVSEVIPRQFSLEPFHRRFRRFPLGGWGAPPPCSAAPGATICPLTIRVRARGLCFRRETNCGLICTIAVLASPRDLSAHVRVNQWLHDQ